MTMNSSNRERLRIGRALADKLTPKRSPVSVAKQLGISTTRLRQIECIALYKVAQRLRELNGFENIENLPTREQNEHVI